MTDPTPAGIDATALHAWFAANVPASRGPCLQFQLIAGGHSNLTFRVDDASGNSFALRRPPLGNFPRGAHDVAREYRIQQALQATNVPVPPMLALCTDHTVIGAPFYVMGWVPGPIIDNPARVVEFLPDTAARQHSAFGLIDALATLHQVDIDAVGLGDLGPRENHLPRLLKRMREVWEKTKTRELPIIESLHERLATQCPPQRRTGLVHADYRFGNVILGPNNEPAAVLDWELCALGDVLIDLGGLLANWDGPGDPWPDVWMQLAPTRAGSFPSREDLLARYAARTGYDIADIDYYQAFCYWRIAVIAEGMKRRYESGAMSNQTVDIGALDLRVRERAAQAERCLEQIPANANARVTIER